MNFQPFFVAFSIFSKYNNISLPDLCILTKCLYIYKQFLIFCAFSPNFNQQVELF